MDKDDRVCILREQSSIRGEENRLIGSAIEINSYDENGHILGNSYVNSVRNSIKVNYEAGWGKGADRAAEL